jgi:hypothetical protein
MTLDNLEWEKDKWDTPGFGSNMEWKNDYFMTIVNDSDCQYSLSWDHWKSLWEIHFAEWQIKIPVEFITSPDFLYENWSIDER